MSIYAISDLHLSFNTDKPMNIFGWGEYQDKIKDDWNKKVKDNDLVILAGDFSWEMKIENAYQDFLFIEHLPGKKILLKGNHDYWWNTLTNMSNFLSEKQLKTINFLYNNSYKFDNTIICGTRGWNLYDIDTNDSKIRDREAQRLELSINNGIEKYGTNQYILACMHYPPLTLKNENTIFTKILEKYSVRKCIYGHLHGKSQEDAFVGYKNNIEYLMTSCDYTDFKLLKIL